MALPIYVRSGKRRYFKPYSPYNEASWINGTHLWRFQSSGGTVSYKIYFYNGDIVRSDGEKSSVDELFTSKDPDGTCNKAYYAVYGKTREEIAADIEKMFIQFNQLNFNNIVFTLQTRSEGGTTYKYHETTKTVGDLSNEHRFVIYNKWTLTGGETDGSALLTWIPSDYMRSAGLLRYMSSENSGLKHEICHVFGLAHESDASSKKTITQWKPYYDKNILKDFGIITATFGNNNRGYFYSQEGKGFIAKAASTTDGGSSNVVESYVAMLDAIYNNTDNTKTRIYGDATGEYPDIKVGLNFGSRKHPNAGLEFVRNGRCRAYLVDGSKKEVMYEVPIDKTGHFCFTLRILPSLNDAPFYILLTSEEFHDTYIKDSDVDVDMVNKKICKIDASLNAKTKTYYFRCILSHTSNNNNKPLFGATKGKNAWYYYWDELATDSKYKTECKVWKKNKQYLKIHDYAEVPLYGYMWYSIAGPLTATKITIGGNNYINSKIDDGTVSGTLEIGGINGTTKARTLKQLEEDTGYKFVYNKYADSLFTKTKSIGKLTSGEIYDDDFLWSDIDDIIDLS